HVENSYADLAFPFIEIPSPSFAMAVDWTLDDLAGYLRSWSATSRYRELHGVDPVGVLVEQQLAPLWGAERRRVIWPLSIKVGLTSSY
ncbi:SAM-dependent methyltransferase, partial [bacterium]|nr:SAM-dependent methyltransferase [bacterium]